MRSPFYVYRGWLIYWEPIEGCYFAKAPAPLRTLGAEFGYLKFGTDASLGRVCDHIRQRTIAGRVST